MKLVETGLVRTAVISAGVAAVTAAVLAGAPALANSAGKATATAGPAVVTGYRAGPVSTSAQATLGSLSLKAGNWVILAKAWLVTENSTDIVFMDCKLTAGKNSDEVRPTIPPGSTAQAGQAIALNLVHSFKGSGGNVTFTCSSFGEPIQANGIRITAIKAGTVTNQTLLHD